MSAAKPKAPAGLAVGGRRLWSNVAGEFELRPDELRVLEDACREVDLVDRMEIEVAKGPVLVPGSRGQDTAHPLIAEVRAHRLVLARLLRQLNLPDDEAAAHRKTSERSTSARKAALTRWSRDVPSA